MAGSKLKSSLKILNPLEIGKNVKSEIAKQSVAGWEDTWAQIYGLQGEEHHKAPQNKKSEHSQAKKEEKKSIGAFVVEMISGQEYKLGTKSSAAHHEKSEKAPTKAEAGNSYHRDIAKSSEIASSRGLTEMERKFEQIHEELTRLVESSNKIVQDEFSGVTMESTPTEVGKYHINFLDWMLIAIQTTRQKVEDSGAWLQTMKGKKGKKGYWGMFKQHGTSFGMSNERSVATQTG